MKSLTNIRPLSTPLQPTLNQAERVEYAEIFPDIRLQDFIYCYWELKTVQPLNKPFLFRVVADGCIDIFFDLAKSNEN